MHHNIHSFNKSFPLKLDGYHNIYIYIYIWVFQLFLLILLIP
jgi:hypothetical protein